MHDKLYTFNFSINTWEGTPPPGYKSNTPPMPDDKDIVKVSEDIGGITTPWTATYRVVSDDLYVAPSAVLLTVLDAIPVMQKQALLPKGPIFTVETLRAAVIKVEALLKIYEDLARCLVKHGPFSWVDHPDWITVVIQFGNINKATGKIALAFTASYKGTVYDCFLEECHESFLKELKNGNTSRSFKFECEEV